MTKCKGFSSGVISLGEVEVTQVTSPENLEQTWRSCDGRVFVYKPVKLRDGFRALGHHASSEQISESQEASEGLLVVRELPRNEELENGSVETGSGKARALRSPVDYTLVWTDNLSEEYKQVSFWLPQPPPGYKSAGYVVSREKPSLEEVVCVREDITADSTICNCIWKPPPEDSSSKSSSSFMFSLPCWMQDVIRSRRPRQRSNSLDLFSLWKTKPVKVGVDSKAICTGTFQCSFTDLKGPIFAIRTLQAFHLVECMPSLEQVHELVRRYAPIIVLHPDESYFPSSVEWFFKNGALLYSEQSTSKPVPVTSDGSNLPAGGANDGAFWLDLPVDAEAAAFVRKGELSTATCYLHVKPMFGGLFTDLQFWLYYPFNGPASLKFGPLEMKLGKIGEHVSDWEHFTIRIDNFTGKPSCIYLGHHSGGTWYQPSDMEYDDETGRFYVYASKNGHACYAHPGDHLQGDEEKGIGLLNATKMSNLKWDVSGKYEIVSAEYLGTVHEPQWLQYSREWGPKFTYNSRTELDKVLKYLPKRIRKTVEDLVTRFPNELSGERRGQLAPKEKTSGAGMKDELKKFNKILLNRWRV